MLSCEAGAAGVGRVVDEDGLGAVRDLAPQVGKINLPALIREQIVCVEFHTEILADWLTKRESRLRHKDAITDLAHDCDGIVEGARAAECKEHIVWVNRVLLSAELISDGLAGGRSASRLRVAVLGF